MSTPGVIDVRIPLDVYPLHYNLELRPDIYTGNPDTFRFDGRVEILLNCRVSTDVISVHSSKLNISTNSITLETSSRDTTEQRIMQVTWDMERQFVVIHLDQALDQGQQYILTLLFSKPMEPNLAGFYWSSYVHQGEVR